MTKILESERKIVKTYGKDRGNRIMQRLREFQNADNLSEIAHVPSPRLHGLHGNREGQFAVDVAANFRMIFEGYDSNDTHTTVEAKIVTLSIIEIEDYH